MSVVEKAKAIGRLSEFLGNDGIEVSEVEDFDQVASIIEASGKPYLTPVTSPMHNDFHHSNALWLVARRDGEPVFLGCARLEDIGPEPVGSYWSRVMRRVYGESSRDVIRSVRPEISSKVRGRLVYFGDLFVAVGGRGSRLNLRAFVALGHLAVSLKWEPDWTYCFIRERDLARGAQTLYGFPDAMPAPFTWIDAPEPRESSEWLALLSRDELMPVCNRCLLAVNAARAIASNNQSRKIDD